MCPTCTTVGVLASTFSFLNTLSFRIFMLSILTFPFLYSRGSRTWKQPFNRMRLVSLPFPAKISRNASRPFGPTVRDESATDVPWTTDGTAFCCSPPSSSRLPSAFWWIILGFSEVLGVTLLLSLKTGSPNLDLASLSSKHCSPIDLNCPTACSTSLPNSLSLSPVRGGGISLSLLG